MELKENEKIVLENVCKNFNWIARDLNNDLYLFSNKPTKIFSGSIWDSNGSEITSFSAYNHLFIFIKYEDKEPYKISNLIDKEKVEKYNGTNSYNK
jgi:hypothetical protein